jgi:hypothetical protein
MPRPRLSRFRRPVAEEVLEPMPPGLDADQRQPQLDDGVPDRVVGAITVERDENGAAVDHRAEPVLGESRCEGLGVVVDLDRQRASALRERAERGGPQQPPALDGHEVGAHSLDLAEQVRCHDHRHPELRARPVDEVEHLVAPRGIEAVRGLVEQKELRVVDECLRELDPLLHAGRVAPDGAVPLLVQAAVAQDLGRPLARGGARQPGHEREVRDPVRRRRVGRQAVVLGHVADELADVGAACPDVEIEHGRVARGRRDEPEQDLDERRLPCPVRADEADDAGFDVDRQRVEGGDVRAVALRERIDGDEGHSTSVGRVPPADTLRP